MRARVIRFGRFELEAANFELRRDARRIKLDGKTRVYLELGDREGAFDPLEQEVDERDFRLTFLRSNLAGRHWLTPQNSSEFERVRDCRASSRTTPESPRGPC